MLLMQRVLSVRPPQTRRTLGYRNLEVQANDPGSDVLSPKLRIWMFF